jgi:curli biogenesis system outer membrane secretion channel CsgG
MRKTNILFSLTAAVTLAFGIARSYAAPTIVVAKTEASNIAGWQPAMGEGLAEMLITELTKLTNFKVLESVALDDLREERALGESGEVSQAESVKKGQWKGADYTFKSKVTRFGSKESTYGGGGPRIGVGGFGLGGFAVRKSENEVQIDWRVIDNASREVAVSGRADGIETGSGFNFGSFAGHGFSDNREFMDSALGKATMKALAQITDKVSTLSLGPGARSTAVANEAAAASAALRNVKGVVKLVEGKEIWISLGANNGFAKGDKVKIYKPVEKKNKKGEVVATDYQLVTEITLSKVQKDKSMGENTSGTEVNEDWAAADAAVDMNKLD